ncbi:hypothetical protein OC845_003614 [Tilletia horrida]|nr:hypothetical protein OC845_003614 [Tilletia horrida]
MKSSRSHPVHKSDEICPDSQVPSRWLCDGGVAQLDASPNQDQSSGMDWSFPFQSSPLQSHLVHVQSTSTFLASANVELNDSLSVIERESDGANSDNDAGDEFELPPGNQLAASRAVIEVSTPASSHTSALRQLTLESQRQERSKVASQERGSPNQRVKASDDSYDTDFGSGSLHRGRVVPSSDLEDNDDDQQSSQMDDFLTRSPSIPRAALKSSAVSPARRATASSSRQRLDDPYPSSIQAILTRPLPRFCQKRPTMALPQHSTKDTDDVVPVSSSPAVVAVSSPSKSHNADATTPHEEYDEDAHIRDSAAAAEESLIVLPRPSKRPRRQASPDSDASLSSDSPRSSTFPIHREDDKRLALSIGAESSTMAESPGQVASPSPPPPPSIRNLADQFGYQAQEGVFNAFAPAQASTSTGALDPPRLAQRAEQCEYIQVMPWHKRLNVRREKHELSQKVAEPKKRKIHKKTARHEARMALVARRTEATPVLDDIPLEMIRPLTECPICGLRWPKSRTGPAKKAHMEMCAESPPASLQPSPAEKILGGHSVAVASAPSEPGPSRLRDLTASGEASLSIVESRTRTDAGMTTQQSAALTASQVHALVNRAIDRLIEGERKRQTVAQSNKTLFAHLVGEAGLARAADQALEAKEARERERQLHLDNWYNQQEELPKGYKPRKKRKWKGKGKSKGRGGGDVRQDEDDETVNPALARLMARRDAETAMKRQTILKESAGDGHADESEPETEQDCDDPMQAPLSGLFPPTGQAGSAWIVPSSRTPSPVKKSTAADLETNLVPAREGRARADAYLRELFPATQMRRYEEDVLHLGLPPTGPRGETAQVVGASQTSMDDLEDKAEQSIISDDGTVEMVDDQDANSEEAAARGFHAALEEQKELLLRSMRSRSVLSEGADNHLASSINSFERQAPKAPQPDGQALQANSRIVKNGTHAFSSTSSSRGQQSLENMSAAEMTMPSAGFDGGGPAADSFPPATQRFRRSRLAEKYGR